MELNQVMRTTFACREYTGEAIPDKVLYDILDNARFAPSGGNRQGNQVIIVRDPGTRKALATLGEPAAKRYLAQIEAGENPWNTVTPSKVTDEQIARINVPAMFTEPYLKADVVLVFLLDLNVVASMDQHLDRVGVISGASIYPFVWNVLLSARNAGFGGTITTLAASREPEVQKLLNIPEHYAVCAIVPLGKPVKQLRQLKRKTIEEIATLERFDGKRFIP